MKKPKFQIGEQFTSDNRTYKILSVSPTVDYSGEYMYFVIITDGELGDWYTVLEETYIATNGVPDCTHQNMRLIEFTDYKPRIYTWWCPDCKCKIEADNIWGVMHGLY